MKNKTNSKRLATFFITVIVLAALVLSTYKNIANNSSLVVTAPASPTAPRFLPG